MEVTYIAPDPEWEHPAQTWVKAVERYIVFVQVPAWRASVKRDGSERSACLSAGAAATLERQMRRVLDVLSRARGIDPAELTPEGNDLSDLERMVGRHVPRHERCSARIHWHFQRAYLLNREGYRCRYCGRTAWGVYAEDSGEASRRTLRFEIDHRITRRRLSDAARFDLDNLAAACRSCNTIKAEMPLDRFQRELESLAFAVVHSAVRSERAAT